MSLQRLIQSGILAGVLCLASAPVAMADLTQQINIDTHSLIGQGPFSLAFQLMDGSGLGDANNNVTLYGFNFGGGSSTGTPTTFGGATGSLATTVKLVDSDPFFNVFIQDFTAGTDVTFYARFTNNVDATFPDLFALSILGPDGSGIPTTDAANDSFMTVSFDGSLKDGASGRNFPGQFFASDPLQTTFAIPAPSAVPEPFSLTLLATVIGALGLRRQFRRM